MSQFSSPDQVLNHPLNNSKAKAQYSFPKADRFSYSNHINVNVGFYDLPLTRSKRTTSFGYGTKTDFTKTKNPTPAPNSYNVSKTFINHRRNFSLGRRDETNIGISPETKKNPGPGAYDLKSVLNQNGWSMASRFRNHMEESTALHTPGPGTYATQDGISKTGQYFFWKFKSSGAPRIGPSSKLDRSLANRSATPGPGTYESISMPQDGSYYLSKYESTKTRTFSRGPQRPYMHAEQTPGPGQYMLPSEFGTLMHFPEMATKSSSKSFRISTNRSVKSIGSKQGGHRRNYSVDQVNSTAPHSLNQSKTESQLQEHKGEHYEVNRLDEVRESKVEETDRLPEQPFHTK